MTDKAITITEEQYKEYMELKKQTYKKVRRWKPKKGESYWYVSDSGRCVLTTSRCSEQDKERFEFSNVYQTDEKAQKELDRMIAEQELLALCDWNGGGRVYLIEYDDQRDIFDWNWFDYTYSPYRFASEESTQKAIATLGTEKLKLIFRID